MIFTALYCTTAEEHPTMYWAHWILQRPLPAAGRPRDSDEVQDGYFFWRTMEGQNVPTGLCQRTKLIF